MNAAIKKTLSGYPDTYPRSHLRDTFYRVLDPGLREELTEKLGRFVRAFCASPCYGDPHRRARLLYEVLSKSLTYDHGDYPPGRGEERYSYHGAILKGKAVCMGISELYTLLASVFGLRAQTVIGYGGDPKRTGGPHAWNLLWLPERDGTWVPYMLDLTWDLEDYASRRGFRYYLKSSAYMRANDHAWLEDRCPHCPKNYSHRPAVPAREVARLAGAFRQMRTGPTQSERQELSLMAAHLEQGSVIPCGEKKSPVVIDHIIGSGSQADVYLALDTEEGRFKAGKHCYGHYADNREVFYQKVCTLARHPSPHPDLCWPEKLSAQTADGAFFYTMPLLTGYRGLTDIIVDRVPMSQSQRALLLKRAALALNALHRQGFIHGDVSHNNVVYRQEGEDISVKILDCDNVSLSGHSFGLQGTGKYRSAALLLGEADGRPAAANCQSDITAFLILAFRVFFRRHPLDGAKSRQVRADDTQGFLEHYAKHPRFIFDGTENAPSEAVRARWEAAPALLRLYFRDAFSQPALTGKRPQMGLDQFVLALDRAFHL